MSDYVKLEPEQLQELADMIKERHPCRFSDPEAANLHRFAQSIDDGDNWQRWNAVIDFGGTLLQLKRAGIIAIVGAIVAAILAALWAGVKVTVNGR